MNIEDTLAWMNIAVALVGLGAHVYLFIRRKSDWTTYLVVASLLYATGVYLMYVFHGHLPSVIFSRLGVFFLLVAIGSSGLYDANKHV